MASAYSVLFSLAALFSLGSATIRLPAFYKNNMVFQADQDQTMMFGFTTDPVPPVLVTVSCGEEVTYLEADPAGFKATKAMTLI